MHFADSRQDAPPAHRHHHNDAGGLAGVLFLDGEHNLRVSPRLDRFLGKRSKPIENDGRFLNRREKPIRNTHAKADLTG